MFASAVHLADASVSRNSNFLRFKLVLQCAKAKTAVLTFAPGVDSPVFTAQQTCIASTGDAADVAHRDVLNKHRRIFEPHRIVNAELTVFISSHRVNVVVASHKAGVARTAGHQAD